MRERRAGFLLDTHLPLRAAGMPYRLPGQARLLIDHPGNEPMVSAASLWEAAVKTGFGRTGFSVEARVLRRGLLDNGQAELDVSGNHAAAVDLLPPIHDDPFDGIPIAQAQVEGIALLTTDKIVGRCPGPIRVL